MSSGAPTVPNDYKYNGKEYVDDLGLNMLDYGARLYDPLTARWNGVDPLAEKYHHTTPFGYVSGDPINKYDPDGRGEYYTNDGFYLGRDGSNDDLVYTADGIVNKHFVNSQLLTQFGKPVKYNDFLYSAAAVFAESSGVFEESYGIASAAMNMAKKYSNRTLASQFAQKNYSYGATDTKPDGNNVLFRETSLLNRNKNEKMRFAIAGVINAIRGGVDYSNGAILWDGRDVLLNKKHFRYQNAFKSKRVGIIDPNNYSNDFNHEIFNYFYGKPNRIGLCKNPFALDTVHRCNIDNGAAPALYEVTGTYGNTIFYNELPER